MTVQRRFRVGDRVLHIKNRTKGRVINVNTFYGWCLVKWENNPHLVEYNDVKGSDRKLVLDLDET